VNLVMATTLVRFAELVGPEDIASGFFARFLPTLVQGEVLRRKIGSCQGE
jgi:hypothetical protein